ncbi:MULTISPECIES: TIGR03085 family metal-binding protein [Amycolatopsis]|uniref:TIGR03085 family metal-binding protein n=1 Tax=Amycolatopsis thermalba TaxID=944492 RepID=A0ABY4NYY9_9PSEU|nr:MULTISPECIES: TIGR03085 family metal-binding protein [Amycolatopsis]OXM75110.1 TIGR03085 family protein [Amycolatopsis sp. KNN50.9b]UQS25290.1 TIGR03085 family metal-binding protein [Amycolatopsis thermalba]
MGVAAEERRLLSLLLDETGPDAPTLCQGWLTRDLAAHLVVRESRPDAALGILLPPLAGHTQRVQDAIAAQPWPELVDRVRRGPAWYWPTSIGRLDELTNTAEFLVHHEDVRRGRPGWAPRPAEATRDAAAWRAARTAARINLRRVPVGVTLRTTDGREATARTGAEQVTVTGDPVELLLFVFGRDAVHVTFDGDAAAIGRLKAAGRGI